jgi:hypothetical protein
MNLNVYLGRKSALGKILLWSPRNQGRWITSKWFRGHHRRVFWPNKEVVLIDFDSSIFSGKSDREQVEILKELEVKERLLTELDRIEIEKETLYLGPPLEFSLFLVLVIFALVLGIPFLIVFALF